MEQPVGWLCLVLNGFLVQSICVVIHSLLFKVLSPGQVEGCSPGPDPLTVDVTEQRDRLRIITSL